MSIASLDLSPQGLLTSNGNFYLAEAVDLDRIYDYGKLGATLPFQSEYFVPWMQMSYPCYYRNEKELEKLQSIFLNIAQNCTWDLNVKTFFKLSGTCGQIQDYASRVETDYNEIFDDIHKIAKLIKDGASSSDIQKVRNDMQPLIEGKLKDIGNIIKAAGETVGLLRNSDEVIKRNRAGILGVRGNLPLRDADPGMGILVSQIDRLVALMDTSAPEMEMAEGECGLVGAIKDDLTNLAVFLKRDENFKSASDKIASIQTHKIIQKWKDLATESQGCVDRIGRILKDEWDSNCVIC